MEFLRRHWATLALALLPLFVVGPALFQGHAIGDFEQVRAMAPWNGPAPTRPWDVLQADSVLQFYGWRDLVFESWRTGQGPWWNPYVLAGTPLLANSQSGGLYPPHILAGWLHLPTWLAIDLLAWFHLAVGGLGMYALVRRLGGDVTGAFVAGVSFQLSPFLLAWLGLASVPSTVCWIPWMLAWATVLITPEASEEPQRWMGAVAGLAGSAAMSLLGGHLQFAAYGFLAVLVLSLGLVLSYRGLERMKGLGAVTTGMALGVLLAAPQLLPVLNYSQFSHRRNDPTESGYAAYRSSALPAAEALTQIVGPFAFGNPTVFGVEQTSRYLPSLLRPGANYAESATTVGPLVLFGALLGMTRQATRRATALLLLLALLALLVAVGQDINRLAYFGVPSWSSTGSPGRIAVILVIALCAAAGLGLSRLAESKVGETATALGLGMVAAMASAFLAQTRLPAEWESGPLERIAVENWTANLVLTGAFGLLALAVIVIGKMPNRTWTTPVAAILFPFVAGTVTLVRTGDPSFLHQAPAYGSDRVATLNAPWSMVQTPPAFAPPNTGLAARIRELSGYDSLLHRETVAMLEEASGQSPFPPHNGNLAFVKPTASLQVLAELGVSVARGRGSDVRPLSIGTGGPGRLIGPGPARFLEDRLNRIVVEAQGPGELVLRDRMMPGWTATVDGREVPLAQGRWRQVQLGPGMHRVVFDYRPPGLERGMLLAGASVLVLALGFAFERRRKPSNAVTQGVQ